MVEEASGCASQSAIGSVGEEAAKLVEVLQRRHQAAGTGRSATNGAEAEAGAGSADGAGSVGLETLVGLLAGMPRAGGPQPGRDTSSPPNPTPDSSSGEHQPDSCAICPLCQSITFVRTLRPDLVEPLERYAAEAARVLRLLAEQASQPHTDEPSAGDSQPPMSREESS